MPRDYQHIGQSGQSKQTKLARSCQHCSAPLRPDVSACPNCGQPAASTDPKYRQAGSGDNQRTGQSPSFSHLVIALVESSNELSAVAKGSTAAKVFLKSAGPEYEGNYEPLESSDRAREAADLFGWVIVPSLYNLSRPDAECNCNVDRTNLLATVEKRGGFAASSDDDRSVTIVDEFGNRVTEKSDVADTSSDTTTWLVPSAVFGAQTGSGSDDPAESLNSATADGKDKTGNLDETPSPGEPQRLHCNECGEKVLHHPIGQRETAEVDADVGVSFYRCDRCDTESSRPGL